VKGERRGWFSRLFRRGGKVEEPAAPAAKDEPAIAFPKAAE
jgi:hypothetical protein